jgi:hypothetical protein
MLTDEPRGPNAIRVQTTQVLIRSPNTSYDLQTTNLVDIYPPPDVVNVDIPEEELECDPPGADHYTNPVMEGLDCHDGHHARDIKTKKDEFKVSVPAAQSQMSECLNQVSCIHVCDIPYQHQHLNCVKQDKFDIRNAGVPLSASNDVVRNETVPADTQTVRKRKRSRRVS